MDLRVTDSGDGRTDDNRVQCLGGLGQLIEERDCSVRITTHWSKQDMNRFKKPAIAILLLSAAVLALSLLSAASAVWGS